MPGDRSISRAPTHRAQAVQLNRLLKTNLAHNPFYRTKLAGHRAMLGGKVSLEAFRATTPFTTKHEIIADQLAHPPYGTNLAQPLTAYTRCHQTSGTTGIPLRWLDTPTCWQAMVECWVRVHQAAGIHAGDRVLFAFSFGPFLGFWLAFEAAERLGALCVPAGGLSSAARLRLIFDHQISVLCCTPTYAMHLAEVAAEESIPLRGSPVRRIIVAGEPGGSIPATRARIEHAWEGASVFDHHGMTEVGPVSYECPAQPGLLHIIDGAFFAEVIDPTTGRPTEAGQTGELILTTLIRADSPLLRYRTGDLVKPRFDPHATEAAPCACGSSDLALEGGILGRVDDMVIVRGVNVYPTAVESILRNFPEIAEYQITLSESEGMRELVLRVEPSTHCADLAGLLHRVAHELQVALSLRVPVLAVPAGSLPRFEMKARRWVVAHRG